MILLSGSTGLLGSHVLKQALEQGKKIKCVYRVLKPRNYLYQVQSQTLGNYSIDLSQFKNIPQLIEILQGVETVIHCAGNATAVTYEKLQSDNLTATQNLYEAAAQAGVKHWIQVSSIATLDTRDTAYSKIKSEAERWVNTQTKIPHVSIIHPTYMLGAWDSKPSSGGVLIAMKLKKIKNFLESAKNFVSPESVASSILKITDRQLTGRFILKGKDTTISEFIDEASAVFKLNRSDFNLLQKGDLEKISLLSEGEQKLVREFCDSSETQKYPVFELHQEQRSLRDMLTGSYQYFKEYKMVF